MTCGFIGHRDFDKNSEYEEIIKKYILNLIVDKKVDRFILEATANLIVFVFPLFQIFKKLTRILN